MAARLRLEELVPRRHQDDMFRARTVYFAKAQVAEYLNDNGCRDLALRVADVVSARAMSI